jgi:hypothetical protein
MPRVVLLLHNGIFFIGETPSSRNERKKEMRPTKPVRRASGGITIPFLFSICISLDQKKSILNLQGCNYDGLRRTKTFSSRIDTDGTKVCFHFRVTKKVIGEKNKAKNTKQKKKRYTRPRRVVAIDPGRVNLIMAYDTSNGKYHRLTRNYYYRACGMKRRTREI